MVLRENPPPASAAGAWDIKVLATDLDTDVLAHARDGIYPAERVEKIAPVRLKRFFTKTRAGGMYQASDELRSLITFKQLNLMDASWPMQGPFDVIFCRNVVIYFDDATKRALVERYRQLLSAGGYLLLGHSESMVGSTTRFEPCGRTIYRRSAS